MKKRLFGLLLFSTLLLLPTLSPAQFQTFGENETVPIDFTNKSESDYRAALIEAFTKMDSSFRADGPLENWFLWANESWVKPNSKTGITQLSAKSFNSAVTTLNACKQVETKLASTGLPRAFTDQWLDWLGLRVIALRFPWSIDRMNAMVAGLPKGECLTIPDVTAFQKTFTQKYPAWKGEDQAAAMRVLDEINPTISVESMLRSKEQPTTLPDVLATLTPSSENPFWTLFRIKANSTILFPEEAWIKEQIAKLPSLEMQGLKAEPIPYEMLRVELTESSGAEKPATLIVATLNSRVDNVAYIQGSKVYKVIALDAPLTEAATQQTWLQAANKQLNGVCRVVLADYKSNRDIRPLVLKDDGTFTMYKTGKKDKLTAHASGTYTIQATSEPWKPVPVNTSFAWPQNFGPTGTCAGNDTSAILAGSMEEAKLVWTSDSALPNGRGIDARGSAKPITPQVPIMGGWASPLVAEGKVIQFYYEPSGNAYSYGAQDSITDENRERYRMNPIAADDVIHCFDAATGRTVWKLQLKGEGLNWAGFNKGGPMLTPAIRDGKVFALGTSGHLYCVDLQTGGLIWKNNIGLRHELMLAIREQLIAEKQLLSTRNDFQSFVILADGVVVVSDHRFTKLDYRYEAANGLIGFEAASGQKLWELPEVAGTNNYLQGPQLCVIGGKEYILAAGNDGTRLIEPKTGKILAHEKGMVSNHFGLAVGDGIVVGDMPKQIITEEDSEKDSESGIVAFHIKPTGFEKAWQLADTYSDRKGGGMFMAGHFYIQVHKPQPMLLCIKADNGQVLAGAPAPIAHGEHCPYTIGQGNLIIACEDRTNGLIFFQANPQTITESVRRYPMELATGYCGSLLPALVDGRLFIRTPNRLVCYDLRKH